MVSKFHMIDRSRSNRPTQFKPPSPEQLDRIEAELVQGTGVGTACKLAGTSDHTFRLARQKDPAMAARFEKIIKAKVIATAKGFVAHSLGV